MYPILGPGPPEDHIAVTDGGEPEKTGFDTF